MTWGMLTIIKIVNARMAYTKVEKLLERAPTERKIANSDFPSKPEYMVRLVYTHYKMFVT